MGHEVTLFAGCDSETSATLIPITRRALRLDHTVRDVIAPTITLVEEVMRRAASFDVIHAHLDYLHLPVFGRQRVPFLTTAHGRLDLPDHAPVFRAFAEAPFVSISHARQPLAFLNWLATIPHGVPDDRFCANLASGGYLAFLGRMTREKRPYRGIRIARMAGMTLRIAAKVDDRDRDYFETEVRPLLADPDVEFVGEISDREKGDFLGKRRACSSRSTGRSPSGW
jgi:glycosyltransferase involved in cell wall biosynthesis